jgi:hypothetical protein
MDTSKNSVFQSFAAGAASGTVSSFLLQPLGTAHSARSYPLSLGTGYWFLEQCWGSGTIFSGCDFQGSFGSRSRSCMNFFKYQWISLRLEKVARQKQNAQNGVLQSSDIHLKFVSIRYLLRLVQIRIRIRTNYFRIHHTMYWYSWLSELFGLKVPSLLTRINVYSKNPFIVELFFQSLLDFFSLFNFHRIQ